MYKEITSCRICGNKNLILVIDLGIQTLTGIFPNNEKLRISEGPLKLLKCVGDSTCGLTQLSTSFDLSEMYGDNYGYRSGLNKSMVNHLHQKIRKILSKFEVKKNGLIIDIGSNDSTALQAYPEGQFKLIGIDPTGVKFKQFYPKHIKLIPEFFSRKIVMESFGDQKAEVITSFSMFYDLEDPLFFMQEVCDTLSDQGVWVFEQSYLPTMLETNSYDTICHEHLEYYGLQQIKWMTDRTGLKIIDVEFNEINGGSFSIIASKKSSHYREFKDLISLIEKESYLGLESVAPFTKFAARMEKSKEEIREFFQKCKRNGELVYGLGASTKGNVILQYCGLTREDIPAIGEVNSDKFGSFCPKTLIPILPEDEVLDLKPDYLMVLPWHFRKFFLDEPKFKNCSLVFPLPKFEIIKT